MFNKTLYLYVLFFLSRLVTAQSSTSYIEYLYYQKEYSLIQHEIKQIYQDKTKLNLEEQRKICFWQYCINDTINSYSISFFEKALRTKKYHKIDQNLTSEYEVFLNYIAQAYSTRKKRSNNFLPVYQDSIITQYHNELLRLQKAYAPSYKSPFLAGLLSVFIPGLGKVYAGKPVQMIVPVLNSTIFALQAIEIGIKSGYKNAVFWIPVSIGGIFYLSDIYGSIQLTKQHNLKQQQTYHAKLDSLLDAFVQYYAYR
ncbi:MAG: hypothetical protein NZ455_11985 [Bacteroidia bacterium]|nr:hypothetical protein [Bacteroidia bacterium]MDW8347181.1 hypothetical protein [Bacteroidia bacterium]